jgi:hypothetical protein
MKNRNLTSLLLAVVMLATLLAGCNRQEEPVSNYSPSPDIGQTPEPEHPIAPDWERLATDFAERAAREGADIYLVLTNNLSLTETEIDMAMDLAEIQGMGRIPRADIAVSLLQSKALYHYACSVGFEPTDEEVRETLRHYEGYFEISDTMDDFYAFTESIGLAPNEYWELHYGSAKLAAANRKLQEYFIENSDSVEGWDCLFELTAEEHDLFWKEYFEWIEEITAQVLEGEEIDLAEIEESLR